MSIEVLLEEIDEVIDKGLGLPGGRVVVNAESLRAAVDEIRLNIPQELKQAKSVLDDRADIINTAKREAESIVKAAEEKARAMVAQEEITRMAQAKAAEIVSAAQAKSREMRRVSQEFVDDLMKRADEGLTQNLADVRKTRAALRQQRPVGSPNAE